MSLKKKKKISLLGISLCQWQTESQTTTSGGEREESTVLTQSQQQRDEFPTTSHVCNLSCQSQRSTFAGTDSSECEAIISLKIHLERTPSPLSMLHSAAFKIMLYLFFFFFFNLHALFHLELIRRSTSQQVGLWPPDGSVWCWCTTDVDNMWQYWSEYWCVICMNLCVDVCVCMCISVYAGVCIYLQGSRTVSWEIRPYRRRRDL